MESKSRLITRAHRRPDQPGQKRKKSQFKTNSTSKTKANQIKRIRSNEQTNKQTSKHKKKRDNQLSSSLHHQNHQPQPPPPPTTTNTIKNQFIQNDGHYASKVYSYFSTLHFYTNIFVAYSIFLMFYFKKNRLCLCICCNLHAHTQTPTHTNTHTRRTILSFQPDRPNRDGRVSFI